MGSAIKQSFTRILALFAALALTFTCAGCGADAPADAASPGIDSSSSSDADPAAHYTIPPMQTAIFHPDLAETEGAVQYDASALAQGYVAVAVTSDTRLKFQVICGDQTYTYDLPGTGEGTVFPLNMGDGAYTFRVMENISGDQYACLWTREADVALESEFAPFLRPSQMVEYDENSACVAKARELAADCGDDADVVTAVYDLLVDTISYDQEKADTVQQGYLPDPDETLATGKGICFDYAALAAAMLRSLGIPCKLITGYVEPAEISHAWNLVYLEHQGWITVEIRADANTWKRVDITFAAAGVSPEELDDNALYTTRYTY